MDGWVESHHPAVARIGGKRQRWEHLTDGHISLSFARRSERWHRPRHVHEPVQNLGPPPRLNRKFKALRGLKYEHDRALETETIDILCGRWRSSGDTAE